ncbi:MAG: magnesium-translocating P-type ATPase [Acidobacteria bacterium]|nr:magnesium-translocating P-type ATPase [Acidobacteriota bacterium]
MSAEEPVAGTPAGLSSAEASRRLREAGFNEPVAARRVSVWSELLPLLMNPLALVLIVAGVISGVLGQMADAAIIVTVVVLGGAINFRQTYRSHQELARLQAQVSLQATVWRDGAWVEVARREVVVGDVVRLSAGDLVPADALLVEAVDLHVLQGALTGESMPAEKAVTDGRVVSPDSPNYVFMGSSVVSGTAVAEVIATGAGTAFGGIAGSLSAAPVETEFEKGLARFGNLILRTVFVLVLFVIVVNLSLRRDPFESLLFAVALAVGLTPEFLPMIVSVTLAQGAAALARHRVIVKQLASIQNLGSIDILCSDKTGTLTTGVMRLEQCLDLDGRACERVRVLAAVNSALETGIRSPLDTAILAAGEADLRGVRKLDEVPFDFERRRLSVLVEWDGAVLLITKGAPESVVACASAYERDGVAVELNDAARARVMQRFHGLSTDGYRVLAVAVRKMADGSPVGHAAETDLTLVGLLAFADPPHPEAREAIAALHRDGIRVRVLTGDNELVTRHVCEAVGLRARRVLTGPELEGMTDPALAHTVEHHTAFARLTPAQKNRIIHVLRARGRVVGFLGDGINDAPSLRAADVGISVSTATDVARDAAGIILLDPGLRVLHAGILAGRKAFGNVMKYLLMSTSSNFGNMFSMAGASLLLPFLPMLPSQILLNNFLYDLAQLTIPSDNVDAEWMRRPRHWDIGLIRRFMLYVGPVSSVFDFLTFFVLLRVFQAGEALFHTGWFVESLATQTLVLFVIRTMRNPWQSRPSGPLALTVLGVVAAALVIPFTVVGKWMGFVALPGFYFVILVGMTVAYLGLVEVVKRRVLGKGSLGGPAGTGP